MTPLFFGSAKDAKKTLPDSGDDKRHPQLNQTVRKSIDRAIQFLKTHPPKKKECGCIEYDPRMRIPCDQHKKTKKLDENQKTDI